MNDPHARSVLNNAAFHLGVDKPMLLAENAPTRPANQEQPNDMTKPEAKG
jgi:hypothetical protein